MRRLVRHRALMHSRLLVLVTAIALPAISQAQNSDSADPYIWLEEVSSPRSMAWVEHQNQTTTNRSMCIEGRRYRICSVFLAQTGHTPTDKLLNLIDTELEKESHNA